MRTGDLKTTYYVLDAQGNAMSNYSFTTRPTDAKANKLVLQERNIYGSKRVGIEQLQLVVAEPAYVTPDSRWEDVWELPAYTPISMRDYHWSWYKNRPSVSVSTYKQEIGDKRYELANHLGNVLNVVTDRKLPVDIPLTANSTQGDGIVDYFTADVVSYSDYLPFGQVMPNRHGSEGSYRYGFNGKERLDEMEGDGNAYDFGARLYNPRLGRWMSRDGVDILKPAYSPYQAFLLNPMVFKDGNGDDEFLTIIYINKQTGEKGYLKMTEPISQNVKAGARIHRRALHDEQSYFDYRHIITIVIDENGKEHIHDKVVLEKKRYTDYCVVCKEDGKEFNPHEKMSILGNGETQNGGENETTDKGGDMPTKTKTKSGVGSNNIDDFMNSLAGFCKSLTRDGKLGDNESTKKISEFVRDGVDKIEEEKEKAKEKYMNEKVVVEQNVKYSDKTTKMWTETTRGDAESYDGPKKYNKTKDTLKVEKTLDWSK